MKFPFVIARIAKHAEGEVLFPTKQSPIHDEGIASGEYALAMTGIC